LNKNTLDLAESYHRQAMDLHQERNEPRQLVEDLVGMARVKLAQGDPESARRYADQVQDYLRENPYLAGVVAPIRTFRYTWEVWVALSEIAIADEVLALAAALMQDYLDKNPDPAVQEMYLCQPHHAVVWQAWQEWHT